MMMCQHVKRETQPGSWMIRVSHIRYEFWPPGRHNCGARGNGGGGGMEQQGWSLQAKNYIGGAHTLSDLDGVEMVCACNEEGCRADV